MKTTKKEVINKIREHILDYMSLKELKENLASLDYPRSGGQVSLYQLAIELVEGGSFLIYSADISDWLNSLGINPDNKEYRDNESFNLYKHLLAREIVKLLK